ncbi:hypothetical protein JCM6882_004105 [Rhodosporidiobolus microsporus]
MAVVSPLSYDLTVRTELPDSFSGLVEIKLNLSEPSRTLTLNTAAPLKLLGGVVVFHGTRLAVLETEHDLQDELTTLSFAEEIPVGEATLALRFEGRLDQSGMLGYYRVPVPSSEEIAAPFYAVTQMQPTSARKVFPCFDHPARKATFSISLISPSGLVSLSNGAQVSKKKSDGSFSPTNVASSAFLAGEEGKLADAAEKEVEGTEWNVVEFETTPKMSTYLVAFAVGDFDSISGSYTSPLTQRVAPLTMYAAQAAGHLQRGQGQLALDTLASVMPVYERLFNIPFEMSKLDMLVCDQHEAGAMENHGLIMGRTSTLLYDSKLSGVSAMHAVVGTVSHEAAHMWFGNLVTPAYWDDLWLNESFATLMGEIVAIQHIQPTWNAHTNFLKTHRSSAIQVDALTHTHAIHQPCHHDSHVSQAFDHISYEKGSAVLKMLMTLIGEDKFLQGTSKFLKRHARGSATSKDLWEAFSSVCDLDVEELMESWVKKVGFPVVTVVEDGENIKLRQQRFLSASSDEEGESTPWVLPLFMRDASSKAAAEPVVFKSFEHTLPRPGELYLLNAATEGFYRVAYPSSHLAKLANEASKSDSRLSLTDRVGIVQDIVSLAEAGYSSTISSLAFIRRISTCEQEFLVWTEITSAFARIQTTWWEQPEEVKEAFKAFAREVFAPMVAKLGFEAAEDEDMDTRRFRALVLSAAAVAEDASVLAWIRSSFGALFAGQVSSTAADLSSVIVWAMAHHGGREEYEIAKAIFANPPTPHHQEAALAGLTGTTEMELLMETAGMLTSGEVQPEWVPHILKGLASNPISRRLVWGLFQQAWPMLEQQYKGSMLLGRLAAASFECFSSDADADAVEAFFADKDTAAFDQPLQQGLDSVRAKARWIFRDAQNVQAWLEKEGYVKRDEEEVRDSGFAQ